MKKSKITAEILCPDSLGKYDFVLDSDMTVGEAVLLISDEIRKYEGVDFIMNNPDEIMLYSDGYALPFDHSLTLEECGLSSGSRLMLI